MSRTVPPQSSSTTPTSSQAVIAGTLLRSNPWNPNRMTAAMYAKILESIQTYGMIDPLTVRPHPREPGCYEIIDGEHRWEGGTDLGYSSFDCTVIEGLTEPQAKKLTIVMNELHGQADPDKLGSLLNDILAATSLEDLLIALPYDETVLAGFIELPALPPLASEPPVKPAAEEQKEPWAERSYRMPKSVALVIDEAIEKAKDGEEIETWQGLERVAAGFLAS